MSLAYYNEFDPKAAAWLRELIKEGHIAPGDVDERSITDVKAHELRDYTQCHFFAGIGGWSKALRLAGVGDDEPRDTGSCPCQPFSDAGKGAGKADARHLWPAWFDILRERRPAAIYGEQVASKAALDWWDGVSADLESAGYAAVTFDLCSAGVGAPTIRQRLFWMAVRQGEGRPGMEPQRAEELGIGPRLGSDHAAGGMDYPQGRGLGIDGSPSREAGHVDEPGRSGFIVPRGTGFVVPFERLGDAFVTRLEGHAGHGHNWNESGWIGANEAGSIATANNPRGFYSRFDLCLCTDGKARRIEPGALSVASGISPGMDDLWNESVAKIKKEIIRYADATKNDPSETLRTLRDGISAKALRPQLGGRAALPKETLLFAALCELSGKLGRVEHREASAVGQGPPASVREMREALARGKRAACSPSGREYPQQLADQLADLVRELPQEISPLIFDGQPLIQGLPGRVGLLRGYGNAINVEVAAEFIRCAEETFVL